MVWTHVLAVRVIDRVGKGVRGAPRDAMLAAWATPTTRGRVYGLQRGMDHLGAVLGPALATLFLIFYPSHYRTLFLWTIVPGAIAFVLILFVREDEPALAASKPPKGRGAAAGAEGGAAAAGALPRRFHLFIGVLTLFTLGNSSDAFLLLRLTDAAGSARFVPLMWSAL